MSEQWKAARAELDRAVIAAVKRFEEQTGMTLSLEIRFERPKAGKRPIAALTAGNGRL